MALQSYPAGTPVPAAGIGSDAGSDRTEGGYEGDAAWVDRRIDRLHALLGENDYRGRDPFDLPNSPFLKIIPATWRLPQLVVSKFGSRLAPDFLRSLLRVPLIEDPKIFSCAYFAYQALGEERFPGSAEAMLRRLVAVSRRSDEGIFWGYDFTWATRYDGVNPRGASTIVPGSFAMLALIHDVATRSDEYRGAMEQGLAYIASRHQSSNARGPFIGYFTTSAVNTHNANLLGAAVLGLGGRLTGDENLLRIAADAATTTIRQVDPSGYLAYNDHPAGGWTDCFHHLYVIAATTAIRRTNPLVDPALFDDALLRMERYYRSTFPRADGALNYFPGSQYPVDPHNYAAAALYEILFDEGNGAGIKRGRSLLAVIDGMMWMPRKGRYMFRLKRRGADERYFLRWTHVWMFLALAAARSPERLRESIASIGTALSGDVDRKRPGR